MPISKQQILDLLTDEKNRHASYIQLCAYYKVEPDPLVLAKCLSKTETLEHILKSM